MKHLWLVMLLWGCADTAKEPMETDAIVHTRVRSTWTDEDSLRSSAQKDCLYSTEYEVCQKRGHVDDGTDSVWNEELDIQTYICWHCGAGYEMKGKGGTAIIVRPPTR